MHDRSVPPAFILSNMHHPLCQNITQKWVIGIAQRINATFYDRRTRRFRRQLAFVLLSYCYSMKTEQMLFTYCILCIK